MRLVSFFARPKPLKVLGANPFALDTVAYLIVTLVVVGIFLGVIWARTKNLVALILIDAATDLLSNFADFVKIWNL
jgi:hypothetical protein